MIKRFRVVLRLSLLAMVTIGVATMLIAFTGPTSPTYKVGLFLVILSFTTLSVAINNIIVSQLMPTSIDSIIRSVNAELAVLGQQTNKVTIAVDVNTIRFVVATHVANNVGPGFFEGLLSDLVERGETLIAVNALQMKTSVPALQLPKNLPLRVAQTFQVQAVCLFETLTVVVSARRDRLVLAHNAATSAALKSLSR